MDDLHAKLSERGLELTCRCGARLLVPNVDDVERTNIALMHAAPPCAKFLEADPSEFMRWLRDADA